MSEYIDFIVRMKDMGSNIFPKIASNAHGSFGKVDADIARTQSRLSQLNKPVKLNVDTSSLEKANSMIGAVVGGNLIATGISKAMHTGMGVVASSLDAAMQYGMQAKSFEVLTGSATAGRKLVGDLRDLKQSTIMGASVYKNAQTMMGFGIGQGEVIKDLREIGDIAMGDQERMASLTLAFAQVRAGGKLMGQDLLQFINAGFNPLAVMSKEWEKFGFKQKMSVGQLKDAMGEGKISSDMVSKAFELATSKGGQFYNMMEQIGETAGGKMAKLHGGIAAMKIDIGNALLPMQNVFVDMANDALHWAHISKTVPETIMAERMEVNALIGSIANLNEGSNLRSSMLDMLQRKYPDLLDGLDKEKVKNEELLRVLERTNKEYERRFDLASTKLLADNGKKELNEWLELATKAKAEANYERMNGGKRGSSLSWYDYVKISKSGYASLNISNNAEYLEAFSKDVQNYVLPKLQTHQMGYDRMSKAMELSDLQSKASDLLLNKDMQEKVWGTAAKKNRALLESQFLKMGAAAKKGDGSVYGMDWSAMERLVAGSSSGSDGANAIGASGSKVTGGGSRPIYINFKNIVENFNNHGATEGERLENAKEFSEEAFLSFIQSLPSA